MIMVEGIKKTKREEFQDKIRIFEKTEMTISDILALYQFILLNDDESYTKHSIMDSYVGVTLVEKVITDLESSDISVPYKGGTLRDFYQSFLMGDDCRKLSKEYRDYDECKDLVENLNGSYKKLYCFYNFFNDWRSEKKLDKDYNLILDLYAISFEWANEFLVSDISLEVRLEMLADLLRKSSIQECYNPKDHMIVKILNADSDKLGRTGKDKMAEKKKELLDAFIAGKCSSYNLEAFLKDLIINEQWDLISYLQNRYFDFNPVYWDFVDKDNDLTLRKISTVAAICKKSGKLNCFRELYKSDGYKNIPDYIRVDNDAVILENLSVYRFEPFIKLSNFEMTEANLEIIIKRIRNYHAVTDKCLLELRKQIIDDIIRKSKNRKELKQALQYVKRFEEETNFEKEEALELAEQVALEEKRKEFSTVLFRLNETLQETVPGKALLKNLDFEKKDK